MDKIYNDFEEAAKAEMDRMFLIVERSIDMGVATGADVEEVGTKILQMYMTAVNKSLDDFIQRLEAK